MKILALLREYVCSCDRLSISIKLKKTKYWKYGMKGQSEKLYMEGYWKSRWKGSKEMNVSKQLHD